MSEAERNFYLELTIDVEKCSKKTQLGMVNYLIIL